MLRVLSSEEMLRTRSQDSWPERYIKGVPEPIPTTAEMGEKAVVQPTETSLV
jgi:hypothetical protein